MMKPKVYQEHCHHIVIDDWMTEEDLRTFNAEFCTMYEHSYEGFFLRDGQHQVDPAIKSRREFNVHDATRERGLQMSLIWNRYLWCQEMRKLYKDAGGIFPYMGFVNYDFLLGAFYGPGDHYRAHRDHFLLTAVFFHQDENNFMGGDFYLGNGTDLSDPNLSYLQIPYKKNRLIIFPSRYVHKVGEVLKSHKDGVEGLRFCTQDFLDIIEPDR